MTRLARYRNLPYGALRPQGDPDRLVRLLDAGVGPQLLWTGALVLSNPDTSLNPFFLVFPTSLLVPIVVLTTASTVIASQAVISGAFALVQ